VDLDVDDNPGTSEINDFEDDDDLTINHNSANSVKNSKISNEKVNTDSLSVDTFLNLVNLPLSKESKHINIDHPSNSSSNETIEYNADRDDPYTSEGKLEMKRD
jgi:hypothetical protein